MSLAVNILVDRTLGSLHLCLLNGSLKLILGGLHQRRMERTANFQRQCTLGTGCFQFLASLTDGIDITRNHQLTGVIIVGRNHDVALTVHLCTDLFHLLVGQTDDGCHRGRSGLTGFLHCHGSSIDELQSVLKAQRAGSHQCRELTERVSGCHVRLEGVAHAECADDAMEEHSGLRHFCLAQILVGTFKHNVGYPET